MNIVLYIALWAMIGLLAGLIAAWLSDGGASRLYANLGIGLAGAILFGYFSIQWLLGMFAPLGPYSLVFALFGAVLLLVVTGRLLR